MKRIAAVYLAVAVAMTIFSPQPLAAQPAKGANAADEAALLKRAEAFVEAFHKGDAKAVAAFWTADGDYTDQSGKRLSGRDAIEKDFTDFFAENKGAKVRIEIDSLRFITPDVAIEDGMTAVMMPDGSPPSRAKYSIVHVKKDGAWSIGSVRESVYTPPSQFEHLRGLENFVGSWAGEGEKGGSVRISFDWAANQNFLSSTSEISFKNISVGGGTQWIGWDAAAKTIRSWSFHNDGGFGEATWTQEGKTWTVKTSATLPDGKKASATDIITMVDADTASFQSKDRMLDGKPQPEIKEVKLKRVK